MKAIELLWLIRFFDKTIVGISLMYKLN